MPSHQGMVSIKELSNKKLWEAAFVALQASQIENFLYYLEALRHRFILATANRNYEITAKRNAFNPNDIFEAPGSPNADAFIGYYKKTHQHDVIDLSIPAVQKAYVIHYDLTGYVGALLLTKVAEDDPDFNPKFERLIRFELFLKILTGFFPAEMSEERIKDFQTELRAAQLETTAYQDLSEQDKKAILAALNEEWSITLDAKRMESFLLELKRGVASQPAFKDCVSLDERDQQEIVGLLNRRKTDENQYTQIKSTQFYKNNEYLGFVLSDEQILAMLSGAESINLNDEQVEAMLRHMSRKCPNFSADHYENPNNFIENRIIAITPELRQAVVRNCINLEGRNLEVYTAIKKAEIAEKFTHRQALEEFVSKTEMFTLEDLKNHTLMGLNKTLLRLETKLRRRWIQWKQDDLLSKKIAHFKQAIDSIRQGVVGESQASILKKLKQLKNSPLLHQHQSWCFRVFKPLASTASVKELQRLIAECENGEASFKEKYKERFVPSGF